MPETLSAQVLRLLARANTWTGRQTFTSQVMPDTLIATPTNAQVKLLPTTPFDLVPAPGVGYVLLPLQTTLLYKAGGVAYTNIHADAFLWAIIGGLHQSSFLGNDPTLTPAMTDLTSFLGSTGDKFRVLTYPFQDDRGAVNDWGIMSGTSTLSALENQPLQLKIDNQAAGVLTGGGAGNTLIAITDYRILALP